LFRWTKEKIEKVPQTEMMPSSIILFNQNSK